MTRQVTIFQVDAFTNALFAGNPAGVVLGAESLTDAELQVQRTGQHAQQCKQGQDVDEP